MLPDPSTLRKWHRVINAEAGFTKQSFDTIKRRVDNEGRIAVNIVLDEMSIRQHVQYANNKFYGYVDLGFDFDDTGDNVTMANNVLVVMAVSLTKHWKIPLGYFFIKSLNGSERANLLSNCLELLHETGAICHSITFDGAPVNLAMCTSLGANFDVTSQYYKPYFDHRITHEKVTCNLNIYTYIV